MKKVRCRLLKNIVLIGFMGSGKSNVGKRLAKKLNMQYIDTDEEIEKLVGKSIPKIFAEDGEVRFRSEETLMLKKLQSKEKCVISTGGGIVLKPENVELMKKIGVVIHLTALPHLIYSRLKNSIKNRPLLYSYAKTEEELISRIKHLMKERKNAYDIADIIVDTSNCTVDEVVCKIIDCLKSSKTYGKAAMNDRSDI